jgi:hypothetical protein
MGRVPLVSSLLHSVVRGGQFRPKPLGAGARRHCPKLFAPVPVVAELASPGPQAARVTLQSVFLREADGAVNLMRNRGAYSNRPVSAQFRRRDLKPAVPVSAAAQAACTTHVTAATSVPKTASCCWIAWNFAIA